jgi:hypothetical protein
MVFFTDLDSRAAIKGSRDPLGLVPVWSRFGRTVVGNLTTVSNSVRGFQTLLLGYYFAEQVRDREQDPHREALDDFLKFEQLAAYARYHVHGSRDFRGTERVVRRVEKAKRVRIGGEIEHQILSDQRTYGLWGLFTSPARVSGLITEKRTLTASARDFVESQYIRRLTTAGFRDGRPIVDLMRRQFADIQLEGAHERLVSALADLFASKLTATERAFYSQHLVDGGEETETRGQQPRLAGILSELPSQEFDLTMLREVIRRASRQSEGKVLASLLGDIDTLESVLVPMESAFLFILTRDRQRPADVAAEIRKEWGRSLRHVDADAVALLRARIAEAFPEDRAASRFVDVAQALGSGDYDAVVRLLLEHNVYVMDARKGSKPWVRIEKGKLDVRYRDESGALRSRDELPHAWRNTYFINSLHSVTHQVAA